MGSMNPTKPSVFLRLVAAALLALVLGGAACFRVKSPSAAPQPVADTGEALPAREFSAGYRKFKFSYANAEGVKRQRDCYFWYPTEAKAERFNYRGQVGHVAEDAEVA